MLKAVRQDGKRSKYFTEAPHNDREVVPEAVQWHGLFLEDASEAFCNDKEVMLAAV